MQKLNPSRIPKFKNDLENVDAPNAGLTDFDIIYTFLVKKPESKEEETEKVDAEVVDDKAAE